MGKKTTTPAFLLKKLSTKDKTFVTANLSQFLAEARQANGGKYGPPKEMLADFMDYLGQKDKRFHNIALNTSHKGTYQIYDPLRKRVQRIEEKPTPSQPKATPLPPAPTPGQKAVEPNQIKDKSTGVPPPTLHQPTPCDAIVQVEAIGEAVGRDEKKMKYYKHQPSSGTVSNQESPSY